MSIRILLSIINILSLFFFQSRCFAQYYDSSSLINAAISLYYELPSCNNFSKSADSLAKELKYQSIIRKCYRDERLISRTVSEYKKNGIIRNVITKIDNDSDSIVLKINKSGLNKLQYSYSFPSKILKDSLEFGFGEIIEFYKLNERRYELNVNMQFIDTGTVNISVSVNDKIFDQRNEISLFPFSKSIEKDSKEVQIKSKWDTTIENNYRVFTKIDSSNSGNYLMSKNYFDINNQILKRFEVYSKLKSGKWILSDFEEYYYDNFKRRYKVVKMIMGDSALTGIDSLLFFPSGKVRSRSIYSPHDNIIFRDSVFSQDGKLLSLHASGNDFSEQENGYFRYYSDNFFTYSNSGLLLHLRNYFNGRLIYSEEFEYKFWEE